MRNDIVSRAVYELNTSQLPWEMNKGVHHEGTEFDVTADDGAVVAAFDCCDGRFRTEEGYANARLISAAPDLYDALERIFLRVDGGTVKFSGDTTWIERARKALEKAGAWN